MTPHRCPVCHGNGQVAKGFYGQTAGQWTTNSVGADPCRSCAGTGVVWEPEPFAPPLAEPVMDRRGKTA
jgi:hypothetical protein